MANPESALAPRQFFSHEVKTILTEEHLVANEHGGRAVGTARHRLLGGAAQLAP